MKFTDILPLLSGGKTFEALFDSEIRIKMIDGKLYFVTDKGTIDETTGLNGLVVNLQVIMDIEWIQSKTFVAIEEAILLYIQGKTIFKHHKNRITKYTKYGTNNECALFLSEVVIDDAKWEVEELVK
jgi:hypothetical protein